jgi:methylenetetrahydrofolate dehydrogenase (NADP+)/methenyltetrahydrofolate cyclohydrolase
MPAQIIDGKAIASKLKLQIRQEVEQLKARGVQPGLAAVLVGDNPASVIYVRNKRKVCDEVGIYSEEHRLPGQTKQEDLIHLIESLNSNSKINGILIQLPLPKQINADRVLNAVSQAKDVDGLHPYNIGMLTMGTPQFVPCTPAGVIAMLDEYKIQIEGQRAVIVGRSNLVGRPLSLLLMHRHATITVCHSRTKEIGAVCREGDILVAAMGKPKFITAEMVKEGAVVIDVGINRLETGQLVGDVDFEPVSKKAGWITPVPGGVGPMTVVMLMYNTLQSAKLSVKVV